MATAAHELPLGKRIRWARKRAGLSQESLALAVGTSRRHVIRWENGQHAPNVAYRKRIAEATGQQPELFSNGDDDDEEDAQVGRDFQRALDAMVARAVERASREKVA